MLCISPGAPVGQISQEISCISYHLHEQLFCAVKQTKIFISPVHLHLLNSNVIPIFLPSCPPPLLWLLHPSLVLNQSPTCAGPSQLHWCGVFPLWMAHPHTPTLTNIVPLETWMGEELISDLMSAALLKTLFYLFWQIGNKFWWTPVCVCIHVELILIKLLTNHRQSKYIACIRAFVGFSRWLNIWTSFNYMSLCVPGLWCI